MSALVPIVFQRRQFNQKLPKTFTKENHASEMPRNISIPKQPSCQSCLLAMKLRILIRLKSRQAQK